MSNRRRISNGVILSVLFLYILGYFLFIYKSSGNYTSLVNGVFISFIFFISYILYGFQKCETNDIRNKIIRIVFLGLFLYFTVIYLLGLFTGFGRNVFSSNIISIIKNSFVPLITVIVLELFRYVFISSNKDSKILIYLFTLLIFLLDVEFNYVSIDGKLADIFVYLTVSVLPMLFKNILLSYLSYQVGYHSNILYVVPLCLYTYIIPYKPNLGNYLTCISGITLPSLLYIHSSRCISDKLNENKKNGILRAIKVILFDIPLIVFFTIVIGLISGYFKYHLIGVNTSNIKPSVKRGDAVLINKGISYSDYEVGDIIAYKSGKKIIIDKVTKKKKDKNGYDKIYVTKEINKGTEDTYIIIKEDYLLGKYVNFRIAKIAYPTIWFKEYIGGDVNEEK